MTLIVKEALIYLFISALASVVFAPIMIGFMYKFKQVSEVKENKLGSFKGTNRLFTKIMNVDQINGTPNMGGVLIMIIVPLITAIFVPLTPQLKVLLIGFVVFGFWGLLDVLFTNAIKENEKLKAVQETFEWRLGKLALSIAINSAITYLLYQTGTLGEIKLWQGFAIAFVPLLIPVIGTISQFAIYANELTDGLDGLMVGIMGIIYSALGALLLVQGNYEFLPFIAIAIGAIIVDLYFNIPPARFWNGGPGAMPLGFGAFFLALVTNNLIAYFVISSITWIIMSSSMIQMLSMKFFKRRVFKIAPIHHHFQAIGWPQYKVTMRFWLFTAVSSILGILIGLFV